MTRITLQADSIISTLPTLLPAASTAPLALLSQQEAIGALLHTINTTIGFELIAIDEVSTPIHADTNLLPVQWNARAPDFTFKYRHLESSTAILTIKILKLSNRTLIHGSKDQVGTVPPSMRPTDGSPLLGRCHRVFRILDLYLCLTILLPIFY